MYRITKFDLLGNSIIRTLEHPATSLYGSGVMEAMVDMYLSEGCGYVLLFTEQGELLASIGLPFGSRLPDRPEPDTASLVGTRRD